MKPKIRAYSEKPKLRMHKPKGYDKFVISFSYIPNPELMDEYNRDAQLYLLYINKSLN